MSRLRRAFLSFWRVGLLLLSLESPARAEGESAARDSAQQRDAQQPAQPPPLLPPVEVPENWVRYSAVDAVITGVFGVAGVVSPIVGPRKNGPTGGFAFDDSVRQALRAATFSGRLRAADVSDVTLGLSVSFGLFFDPFVNASWLRESPDVGLEMGLVNLEVFAVTLGIQQFVANRVGRERPFGDTCRVDEVYEDTHECHSRNRYRSFFSGHSAVSFSMAAATCVHHVEMPLSYHSAGLACGVGFALAAVTGGMRIVSDNHYASDVIAGALLGTGVGLLVPLLHYRNPAKGARLGNENLQIWVAPQPRGLTIGGTF